MLGVGLVCSIFSHLALFATDVPLIPIRSASPPLGPTVRPKRSSDDFGFVVA